MWSRKEPLPAAHLLLSAASLRVEQVAGGRDGIGLIHRLDAEQARHLRSPRPCDPQHHPRHAPAAQPLQDLPHPIERLSPDGEPAEVLDLLAPHQDRLHRFGADVYAQSRGRCVLL
jgi:hypothetical protein